MTHLSEQKIEEKVTSITDILECDRLNLSFQVYYDSDNSLILEWTNSSNASKRYVLVLDPYETEKLIRFVKNSILLGGEAKK
jgi:hypothetical protein